MRKIFLILPILILVALMGCTKEAKPPVEGNPAPDFTLNTLTGEVVSFRTSKGQVVLLNFGATWRAPPAPGDPLHDAASTQPGGESRPDALSSHRYGGEESGGGGILPHERLQPPCPHGHRQARGNLYGLTGVPETFVIDRNGVILKKVVGAMEWDRPEVIAFLNDAVSKAR